ncbi:MAG: hypothetical protein RJQ09_02960 [Cyclobacteriaceae bacterium]
MIQRVSVSVVFVLASAVAFGQAKESDMYRSAYTYLNDLVIKTSYVDAKKLKRNCRQHLKVLKLKFDDELKVASRFIKNDSGFPYCDFIKKKYSIEESCAYALGSGEFELFEYIKDSLETFWDNYEIKENEKIAESLNGLISETKNGHIVFFSDIYKNSLAAEIKSFCQPYDEVPWFGSSTSFFFIFDDNGKIKELYSETVWHYN